MTREELNMRARIQRLEDKMLRSKNIQEQMEIRSVLFKYRKRLQAIILKNQYTRGV